MKKFLFLFVFISFTGCGSGLNLFSISDDRNFGEDISQEIENDPDTYPLLNRDDYPEAYAYLEDIRDEVLNSGVVDHRDDFDWEVHIINDDEVLNAFATPGGYLYFYTGLIKFLDTEDSLAGVMGHEIAHAAERHSTEMLTTQYGVSTLLAILLGQDQNILVDIAQTFATLDYSRENESDADEHSVAYLAGTFYACNGAADFFEKLIEEDLDGGTPEFLSTHPSPESRVDNINSLANEEGCDTTPSGRDYDAFKDMLP
ncbi:M48 family metalloprotease [bacterium]|nr:M48 family metalloprotease [bacterium]